MITIQVFTIKFRGRSQFSIGRGNNKSKRVWIIVVTSLVRILVVKEEK